MGHAEVLPVRAVVGGDFRSAAVGCRVASVEITQGDRAQAVTLAAHPQPFGGERWWWICPHCSRRRAALYRLGGSPWACRGCLRLTYASRREGVWHRAERRLRTLAPRLGITAAEVDDWRGECPPKPKGMHWRTYDRLAEEWSTAYERGNLAGWEMMARLMGITPGGTDA